MMTMLSLFLLRALSMITRHSIATLLSLLLFCVVPAAGQEVKGPTGLPAGQTMGGVTTANLVCDGVTDNYATLSALITAANAGTRPNTIYFPPASQPCLISQSISPSSGVNFWASPGSVTLKAAAGNASTVVLLSIANSTGNNISGLTFDGGGVNHSNAGNVLQVFQSSNVVFQNVTVQNTHGVGAVLSTSIVNSGFKDSLFKNVGNHWVTTQLTADRQQAIAFCCGTTTNNHGNFVSDSYFTNIGLDAVSATQQNGFNVVGNRFDMDNGQLTATWQNPQPTAFGACIYGFGGDLEFEAVGNTCNKSPGNGIDVAAGGATVSGNYVTGAGQGGIGVFNPGTPSTTTITGNNVVNSFQWPSSVWQGGIVLSGAYGNVSITGNVSSDIQGSKTQNYGLQILAGSTFNDLRIDTSNSLTGNKLAPVSGMIADFTQGGTKTNYILNPCAAVDQRNEGASYAAGGGNRKVIDQWVAQQTNNAWTTARSSLTANGCVTALTATVTGSLTPGSSDTYAFYNGIEGNSLQDLSYGTANAQPVTLEFQAKTSCAGQYGVSLQNATASWSYVATYTLTANTLTPITIVVPGDQVHTFGNTTSYALFVIFDLGTGSARLATAPNQNAWVTGNYSGAVGDTSFANCTNGSTFSLTGVRLYPGTGHVPWNQLTQAETLAGLQRYYSKSFPDGTAPAQNTGAALGSATMLAVTAAAGGGEWIQFPSRMRVAPAITFYSTNAATSACWDVTAAAAGGASSAVNTGANGFQARCASATTAADTLQVHWAADAE